MLYVRLIDGYGTDALYSIRKENGWEGVKMELLMTNEKISGIIGGEKIPVHTEHDYSEKEYFQMLTEAIELIPKLSDERLRKIMEALR